MANFYRVDLPYTTRTTGVDVTDLDNLFRFQELDKMIDMLNQDDGTLYRALRLWSTKPPVSEPLYRWIEDDMLGISTTTTSAYGATDTTLAVADVRLFLVRSEIHVPRTLENMLVTAVDYTNGTVTVDRGFNGSPAAALLSGEKLICGITHLPELADANEGTGRVPGDAKYNLVSRFSETLRISDMQEVCAMIETGVGKVATVTWEMANKMLEIKRKINKALIFQHRGMDNTSTGDGTLYVSQGFVHYMDSNVLNLGDNNANLTWPILSDWLDSLFDNTASGSQKMVNCGPWLFGAMMRMRRDMSAEPVAYFNPDLGQMTQIVTTEEGNEVVFVKDKHGFPANEGLAGWGIVVDMKHAFLREFANQSPTWRMGIQHNKAHFRQDEYWGSFSLELRHPECHGFIRGAEASIIDR